MSTVKANNVQVGQSGTATNNFTLYQPSTPDGTVRLAVGNSGATSADVLTANSSGNVGIGVTPSAWGSTYKALQVGGGASIWAAAGNSTSTYASNLYFDGASYRYINTGVGHLFAQSTTGRQQFYGADSGTAGDAATVTSIFSIRKGYTTVLQGGSETTGTGIAFPATQSASSDANTLDDYEEGTWTPTIIGSSTAGTVNYGGSRVGRYTKIGRLVQFECYVNWSSGTGTGNLQVSGLPFTPAGGTYAPVACTLESVTLTANNYACPYVYDGNTYVAMAQNPTGGGSRTLIAYDAVGEIQLMGTYSI